MYVVVFLTPDVGDAWRDARGSDEPQVRNEQQQ